MNERIEFTSNYDDLSTETGFQFEFKCDRCSSGYRTRFAPFATGSIANALGTASNLFGGIFNQAAQLGESARSASWQRAKDEAFLEAAKELRPQFRQCPRCQSWVCNAKCWNEKRGLCKSCAPDLGVEMSAAQASHSVQEIWAHARMAEEDKKLSEEHWDETIRATCPECSHPLEVNAKFCPNCGAKLKSASHCSQCGVKLQPGAKFCTDCGAKV